MSLKSEIIDNELMRTIAAIRVNTLWKMLAMRADGLFPKVGDEGATGDYDNKGALFVPGGLILGDSEGREQHPDHDGRLSATTFRTHIYGAMQRDNATLLYANGIVKDVNLPNEFFIRAASSILSNQKAVRRRKRTLSDKPPETIGSDQITRSNCPPAVTDYGARTRLSSCLAVCANEPDMFYRHIRTTEGLHNGQDAQFWRNIVSANKPIMSADGKTTLAQPHIVVCHTTRYRPDSFTGLTRILGIRRFGEFATFTLERATHELLGSIEDGKIALGEGEAFATHDGMDIAGVLRVYEQPQKPGRRPTGKTQRFLVHPTRDLRLDLETITAEARDMYKIN